MTDDWRGKVIYMAEITCAKCLKLDQYQANWHPVKHFSACGWRKIDRLWYCPSCAQKKQAAVGEV